MSQPHDSTPSFNKQDSGGAFVTPERGNGRPRSVRLSPSTDPIRFIPPGIYALSGVIDVRIERSQLRLSAGIFDDRRELLLSKAEARLSRLVILGHSGSLTLDALRWLKDTGAGVIQLDYDASVIFASAPSGLNLPALRRAQALAAHNPAGVEIVREILSGKVAGQANVCRAIGNEGAAMQVERYLTRIDGARSMVRLRSLESQAAAAYWRAWELIPVLFARRDESRVPRSWRTFGNRASPLTDAPRRAGNPANALLNYLYGLLEAETRVAVLTMGLDPGLGILHADQPNRDSLVYDLMEPARPAVDAWLLGLLRERRFARGDFCESPDGRGQIMLTKPLAHELTATLPVWARVIAPIVEQTARSLLTRKSRTPRAERLPTKLTESHRSDSRKRSNGRAATTTARVPRSCIQCGKPVSGVSRYCSPDCKALYHQEVLAPGFNRQGAAALSASRAAGEDPAHGGEAAKKRGDSNRRRSAERVAWEQAHSPDELETAQTSFRTDILPALAEISTRRLSEATGLSLPYAAMIRAGKYCPHPMHHLALAALILERDRPAR